MDGDFEGVVFQFVERQQVAVVDQRKVAEFFGVPIQVVEGFDAIDEDQVGAGFAIGARAADNVVPSVGLEGVGARDDYEIRDRGGRRRRRGLSEPSLPSR